MTISYKNLDKFVLYAIITKVFENQQIIYFSTTNNRKQKTQFIQRAIKSL